MLLPIQSIKIGQQCQDFFMKKLLLAILTIVLGASFIYPPAIIRAKDDVLLAVNSKVKL